MHPLGKMLDILKLVSAVNTISALQQQHPDISLKEIAQSKDGITFKLQKDPQPGG